MEKTQGQISENSGSKLKNSGFGISPNLVKFSRTAQKKPVMYCLFIFHFDLIISGLAFGLVFRLEYICRQFSTFASYIHHFLDAFLIL